MRPALRAVALGAFGALAAAAPAGATPIFLPSATALAQPPPPLLPGATPLESEHELRFPGHVGNSEVVEVGLRDDGSASSVAVTQRLVISRIGDYSFTIPAPALSVVPAGGSQSQPGLRNTGIVWQGFSSGHGVLAARVSLKPLAAERGLPLGIRIEQRADATVVRVINIARRGISIARGTAPAGSLRVLLERARAAVRAPDRTALTQTLQVDGTFRGSVPTLVVAPLRVGGTIRLAGRSPTRIDWVLGRGQPLVRTVTLPARAAPRLSLTADLLDPEDLLPRPGELEGAGGLAALGIALARIALSAQYGQYLAAPDQLGRSRTTYVFRTAPETQTLPPRLRPAGDGGSDVVAIVLGSILGGFALVGLVVAWAHS
jgi:hypothetical protein